MSDKMPTAEEFSKKHNSGIKTHEEMALGYIEFAKLHVEEALKTAAETGYVRYCDHPTGAHCDCPPYVDKESILTAYPLDLIK